MLSSTRPSRSFEATSPHDYRDMEVTSGRGLSSSSLPSIMSQWLEAKQTASWKHTLGILLLLVTVVLWTTSNFLASTIFADNTYSKPYFVTYINSSFFIIPLIPILVIHAYRDPSQIEEFKNFFRRRKNRDYTPIQLEEDDDEDDLLKPDGRDSTVRSGSPSTRLLLEDSVQSLPRADNGLTLLETAKLSLEFSILWFLANYFAAACLEYTTVASSTILTSTSSIWTLIAGAALRVEHFTFRKLSGVLASITGIALIATIDVSSDDADRGTFPEKTSREIALGDAMAFISAVLYGFYAVLMKARIGDAGRVNMPLFFGLVGMFNVACLWPGLIILHLTGVERFELPPTSRVLTIVLLNSASSLISDFCWAWAMLLTSPLIVTVGLSLTIPLSLVGQMVIRGQYEGWMYWVGACVVLLSFVFINREETKEETAEERERQLNAGHAA